MPELLSLFFNENTNIYLQDLGSPFIDILFKAITATGSVPVLFILGVLIFWCYNKKTGIILMYVVLFSTFTAILAKNVFGMPRPPEYLHKIQVTEFGFPSGHALVSSGFWGYLGLLVKKRWFVFLAVLVILSVSFSRVYLGVHYTGDVAGGILFGLFLAFMAFMSGPGLNDKLYLMDTRSKFFLALAIPAIVIVIATMQNGLFREQVELGLVMASTGIGYLLEQEHIDLEDATNDSQRVKRAFTGIILLLIVYSISVMFCSIHPVFTSLKYPAMGFTSTFVVPLVFTRIEREPV